ncbi:Polysaccharide biosynthesis protein [Lachnospiraceae bacterium XBB1006]|nr:Polysaccharide biosynthesis protein [Lachnospiraceae bacterium XBB1006]
MVTEEKKVFHLDEFINTYVTKRKGSMFEEDIADNRAQLTEAIAGKSVLVIGGAGSIGSSFVKEVLDFRPEELYIVDINENALTELTRSLRSSGNYMPPVYCSYPMDYSSVTFCRMFTAHKRKSGARGFDIVANFSAHKHVRSEKDIYSVEALLRNNVIHAKGLMELLEKNPPEEYFCVSTDKAANPVNIMGASKRIMEDLIFAYSDAFPVKTARFANVAFSNGSLPAGFLERMKKLQPLSAPSDVRRYFVSPEESGQICMLSAMLGQNREIFFPKLEEAQMETFDRIAENLLVENGYEILYCDSDEEAIRKTEGLRAGLREYPVHFSPSDTSGEKAYEEFFVEGEAVDMQRFRALGIITDKPVPDKKAVLKLIDTLEEAFEKETTTKEDIVQLIATYLPNFEHIETGKSLDAKM